MFEEYGETDYMEPLVVIEPYPTKLENLCGNGFPVAVIEAV